MGDWGFNEWVAGLGDRVEHVRRASAQELGQIGYAGAVEPLIVALRDTYWFVREAAAEALGKIGSARAVEPLIAALQDKNSNVRQAAASSLDKLRAINQRLAAAYPHLLCNQCRLRVEKRFVKTGFMQKETWFACRGCGSLNNLLAGVEHVIGLTGGTGEDIQYKDSIVTVRLWNETDQIALNADIDSLVIRAGGVSNYERAVNAVINALRGDVSRQANWCKIIPVKLEGAPALSVGAMRMLEDTFGEMKVAQRAVEFRLMRD